MINSGREDDYSAAEKLAESDQALIGVDENLIDSAIGKDFLCFTDQPIVMERKANSQACMSNPRRIFKYSGSFFD